MEPFFSVGCFLKGFLRCDHVHIICEAEKGLEITANFTPMSNTVGRESYVVC